MEWWHHLHSETRQGMARTGLPRKVLRHLVTAHGVGVGSRVLDVGCGEGTLVRFLQDLGISATGCEESPIKLAAARRNAPRMDLVAARSFEEGVPFAGHQFDLVLVRNLSVYWANLLRAEALRSTAHLAACVRPGGFLVFLDSGDLAPDEAGPAHEKSCFLRHVSLFRGAAEVAEFPDRRALPRLKRTVARSPQATAYRVTGLRIPKRPLPRSEWLRQAENALEAPVETCCPRAAHAHWNESPRRVA